MRIHRLLGRGVVAHRRRLGFADIDKALTSSRFKAAARFVISLEPELLPLAQIRDDGQRHAFDVNTPAAKHAPRRAMALGGEQIAAIVCKLAVDF